MTALHVIFGAGQVGARLARALVARGHRVRVVRRSDKPVADGVEVVSADAMDPDAAVAAAQGADVVYHCMNPSAYSAEAWESEFPRMGEAVIAAALDNEARLVCLDNVYAYGEVEGPRAEDTPMRAAGPKGRVRIAWDARLREAGRTQGLRWTVGRGGDFFGPGTSDQSLISMDAAAQLGRGLPALVLGRPWLEHSFSYIPDAVDGLVALGQAEDDVEGRAWHLPVHTLPPRELARRIARAQGRRGWTVRLPVWLMRALAPVVPLFAMLDETLYQWDDAFLISDDAFKARFPEVGVTTDEAIAQIAATIRGEEVPSDPSSSPSSALLSASPSS